MELVLFSLIAIMLVTLAIGYFKKKEEAAELRKQVSELEIIEKFFLSKNWEKSFNIADKNWPTILRHGFELHFKDELGLKSYYYLNKIIDSEKYTITDIMNFIHKTVTIKNTDSPLKSIFYEMIENALEEREIRLGIISKRSQNSSFLSSGEVIVMVSSFLSKETTMPIFIGEFFNVSKKFLKRIFREVLEAVNIKHLKEDIKYFNPSQNEAALLVIKFFSDSDKNIINEFSYSGAPNDEMVQILSTNINQVPEIVMV